MSLRALAAGVLCLCCAALTTAAAPRAADDKKPEKKDEKKPEVVLSFNLGADDPKATALPTGTDIRIRVETDAGAEFAYVYHAATLAGETVGNIAEQVLADMEMKWNVKLSSDGRSVIVTGRRTPDGLFHPVTKAGIHYSTKAQPITPKVQGGVQLLDWDAKANKGAGVWVGKPEL